MSEHKRLVVRVTQWPPASLEVEQNAHVIILVREGAPDVVKKNRCGPQHILLKMVCEGCWQFLHLCECERT
jgi:hypothetical protein